MTIADNLQTLIDCKADMKSAIEEKGVTVSGGLSTYADAIRSIEGGTEIIGAIDFSKLGYNSDEITNCNSVVLEEIEYGKDILDNWNALATNPVEANINLSDNTLRYFPKVDTSNMTDMTVMFSDATSLAYVPLLNTSKVTNMNQMFAGCESLSKIELIDTSKVTTMGNMFSGCLDLRTIPQFDTRNVTNMTQMFYNSGISILPLLNTSKVTNMRGTFAGCKQLKTIPQLDTSKVTTMYQLFYNTTNLESLPLIDMSNVSDFTYMFGPNAATSGYFYDKLTDFGGFKNLGMVAEQNVTTFNMIHCRKMSVDSAENIIDNLYDRATVGYSILTLNLPYSVFSNLSSYYIEMATAKGWNISA